MTKKKVDNWKAAAILFEQAYEKIDPEVRRLTQELGTLWGPGYSRDQSPTWKEAKRDLERAQAIQDYAFHAWHSIRDAAQEEGRWDDSTPPIGQMLADKKWPDSQSYPEVDAHNALLEKTHVELRLLNKANRRGGLPEVHWFDYMEGASQ